MNNNQNMKTENILVLQEIQKKYGKVEALKDLNLSARRGEICYFRAFGCGKNNNIKNYCRT